MVWARMRLGRDGCWMTFLDLMETGVTFQMWTVFVSAGGPGVLEAPLTLVLQLSLHDVARDGGDDAGRDSSHMTGHQAGEDRQVVRRANTFAEGNSHISNCFH